jgi:hypothetical protein
LTLGLIFPTGHGGLAAREGNSQAMMGMASTRSKG